MTKARRELDLRQKFDDGPGSLGISLPRGAAMGLRLYRLSDKDGAVTGHTLEVECWEIGTKIYIRLDADGDLRIIKEGEGGVRRRIE